MNNYVYIISCVPELLKNWSFDRDFDAKTMIEEIKSLCSEEDNTLIDSILDGFAGESLCKEFYEDKLKSKNKFIKDYFSFDLMLRNAKVSYLNRILEREREQDMILLEGEIPDTEELESAKSILEGSDILAREKGLDDLIWDKVDSLISLHLFDIDIILSIVVKLKIIDRWLRLDESTGREYFKSLSENILKNFEGLEFNE